MVWFMSDLHPGVVVLLLSGLTIFWLTPISAWWMLLGQGDRHARLWFTGTALYALVATLFVFGTGIPVWLRAPLMHALSLASLMCMTEALRREIQSTPAPVRVYTLIVAIGASVQWGTHALGWPGSVGLAWQLLTLSAVEVFLMGLTHRVRRHHRSRALWLILFILFIFVLSNLARVAELVWTGRISLLLDFTFLASASLVVNYLSVVFYCYGYWGFVIEKNQALLVQAGERTALAVRGEALALQREQMAEEMLRQRTAMMERLANVGKLAQFGALSASIAHEINQPLAAITLNIEEARRRAGQLMLSDGLQDLLQRIDQDNVRAANVVRRVRSMFSQHSLQLNDQALDPVVHSVMALLEQTLRQERVEVTLRLDAGAPFRFAAGEIEHMLLNLIDNAMQAMRQTGQPSRHIHLETWREGQSVCLAVSDNGPGIPQQLRAHLFELRETSKNEGMGLGLWLARYIVERHAGTLVLDEGHTPGARFVMRLPQHA